MTKIYFCTIRTKTNTNIEIQFIFWTHCDLLWKSEEKLWEYFLYNMMKSSHIGLWPNRKIFISFSWAHFGEHGWDFVRIAKQLIDVVVFREKCQLFNIYFWQKLLYIIVIYRVIYFWICVKHKIILDFINVCGGYLLFIIDKSMIGYFHPYY